MCNHNWVYDKAHIGRTPAQCKCCGAETVFFFAPITPKTRALLYPFARRTMGGSNGAWENGVKVLEAKV